MILLPLHYFKVEVGKALVDDQLAQLSPKISWRLDLPNALHKLKLSPDVLVARLREDTVTLHRCIPVTAITAPNKPIFVVRLSKVALQHNLIPLLNEHASLTRTHLLKKEPLRHKIISLCQAIGPISFVNGNRVDCRSENLREIPFSLESEE